MNFRKRASEMAQQVRARVQSQESDLSSQDPHKGGGRKGLQSHPLISPCAIEDVKVMSFPLAHSSSVKFCYPQHIAVWHIRFTVYFDT